MVLQIEITVEDVKAKFKELFGVEYVNNTNAALEQVRINSEERGKEQGYILGYAKARAERLTILGIEKDAVKKIMEKEIMEDKRMKKTKESRTDLEEKIEQSIEDGIAQGNRKLKLNSD